MSDALPDVTIAAPSSEYMALFPLTPNSISEKAKGNPIREFNISINIKSKKKL